MRSPIYFLRYLKKATKKVIIRCKINANHRIIIKSSNKEQFIRFNPILLDGGSIEHYYHFIFDLLLPISFIVGKSNKKTTFLIHEFGELEMLLKEILKDRIDIISENQNQGVSIDLIGMNPSMVFLNRNDFIKFKDFIFTKLNVNQIQKRNKIIIIERAEPTEFYLSKAKVKGGGSLRRSIINHKELVNRIKQIVLPEYEFLSLVTDDLKISESVNIFNQSVLIIGQYGAGLSNMMWMEEKSFVIEFGFKNNTHFKDMSSIKRHKHFLLNYNENHIKVDINEFASFLLNNSHTKKFFKSQKNIL